MSAQLTGAESPALWRLPALRFLLAAAAWNVVLFALLRTAWFEQHALLPFTRLQAAAATWYAAQSASRVTVSLECSGTDVLALCAGFMLAYPAPWRRRAAGIATILPALLLLNVVRIATLSAAASSPNHFKILHEYAWPLASILSAAGLVYLWVRSSGQRFAVSSRAPRIALYCFGGFVVATPWFAASSLCGRLCGGVAGLGAVAINTLGGQASTAANVLSTPRGAFTVTPECILSPVIPLWVAAVLWWPLSRRSRMLGLLLTLPVVAALATARLVVLAAPGAWVESPIVIVHGFHQLVLFAALVMMAAAYGNKRPDGSGGVGRGLAALGGCAVGALVLGATYNRLVVGLASVFSAWAPHTASNLRPADDAQGALLLLPVYQTALFIALPWAARRTVRWSTLAAAVIGLFLSQALLLVGVGELAAHSGIHLHALILRGWAVVVPVGLALLVRRASPPVGQGGGGQAATAYRTFWDDVGEEFPDLGGAASTELYRQGERRLVSQYLPDLAGKRVFKSDLWDEARNTRILQWIEQRGARVFGIDIAKPTIELARSEFGGATLHAAGGDVRALPFQDASFDAIYSMGTIEHFAETEQAIAELLRVLKPGGRAIIGVPNRHDPFLRPLMVALLYRLGLYGYGFEKSYSRGTLRRMLTQAGFSVVAEDGVLFIPGWLRMLDLLCHTRFPRLARLTATAVHLFTWLERHVPALHRHGYLIAAIAERLPLATQDRRFSTAGREWLVDAFGCNPQGLRSRETLQALFAAVVSDLGLHTVGQPLWHVFDGEAGITGLQGLSESHLACHTYPEAGYAAFSLYCCRPGIDEWPWRARLTEALGAQAVMVRVAGRGELAPRPSDLRAEPEDSSGSADTCCRSQSRRAGDAAFDGMGSRKGDQK